MSSPGTEHRDDLNEILIWVVSIVIIAAIVIDIAGISS